MESQPPKTMESPTKREVVFAPNPLKRASLSAAGLALLGLFVVMIMAGSNWYDRWSVVLIMALASLPITLVATVIGMTHKDEASWQEMLGPAIISFLVSTILGTFGGFLWREDVTRSWVLSEANTRGAYDLLDQAARSQDPDAAARACVLLLDSASPAARDAGFGALASSADLANVCLTRAKESPELTARLVDHWYTSMQMQGDDASCRHATSLATIAETFPRATTALLSCAVSDPSEVNRACCADALAAKQLSGGALAQLSNLSPEPIYEEPMAPALLRHAFSSKRLPDQASKDRNKALRLEEPGAGAYALELACRNVTPTTTNISQAFYTAAHDRCGLRAKELGDLPGFWVSLCGELSAYLGDDSVSPEKTQKKLCEVVNQEATSRAVKAASTSVDLALRIHQNQGDGRYDKMMRSINSAGQDSGFEADDSTGIVQETERGAGARSIRSRTGGFEHLSARSFDRAAVESQQPFSNKKMQQMMKRGDALEESGIKLPELK